MHNFLGHLSLPIIFVNDVLQGETTTDDHDIQTRSSRAHCGLPPVVLPERAAYVRRAAGYRPGQKSDPATRTFQAIRIHVNQELAELEGGLAAAERRTVVIDSIAGLLDRLYVFPEVATRMKADLRSRAARGEYDSISEPDAFARTLTEQLQAISHDKHLRVRTGGPPPRRPGPAGGPPSGAGAFGRTERLAGDVAYVEIRSFGFPPEAVREATRDIMSAAADAKALIIDVRSNGGGSPQMVALVSSYLFGDTPVRFPLDLSVVDCYADAA